MLLLVFMKMLIKGYASVWHLLPSAEKIIHDCPGSSELKHTLTQTFSHFCLVSAVFGMSSISIVLGGGNRYLRSSQPSFLSSLTVN